MSITINKYDIVDDNPKEISEQYVIQNFDDFIELLFEVFNLNNTKSRQMIQFKLQIIKILEKFRKNFKIENIKPKMIQTLLYYDISIKHLFEKNKLNSDSIYQLIKLQILIFINKIKNIKNIESLIDIFTDKITNIIPLITPDNIIGLGPGPVPVPVPSPGPGPVPSPGSGSGSGPGDQNPDLNSMTKAYKFFSSQLFPMLSKKTYVPYGFRNNNFKSIVDESQIASLDTEKIKKILDFIKDSELLNLGDLKIANFISSLTTVARIIKDTSMSANTIETWITSPQNKSAYDKDKQHILSFNNTISVFITYYIYDLIETQKNFDQKKKLLKYLLLIYKNNVEITKIDKIDMDINIDSLDDKNMNILLAYLLELIQEYLDTSILFYEILNFNKTDIYQAENFIINEFLVKPWTVYLASIKRIELDDILELNFHKENNSFFNNNAFTREFLDKLQNDSLYFKLNIEEQKLLIYLSDLFINISPIKYEEIFMDENFKLIIQKLPVSQTNILINNLLGNNLTKLNNLNLKLVNKINKYLIDNKQKITYIINKEKEIIEPKNLKNWITAIKTNTKITPNFIGQFILNNILLINIIKILDNTLIIELLKEINPNIENASVPQNLKNRIEIILNESIELEIHNKMNFIMSNIIKTLFNDLIIKSSYNNNDIIYISDEIKKYFFDVNNIDQLINNSIPNTFTEQLKLSFEATEIVESIVLFIDFIKFLKANTNDTNMNNFFINFKNYKNSYFQNNSIDQKKIININHLNNLIERINSVKSIANDIFKKYLKCFFILFTNAKIKIIFRTVYDNYSMNNNINNNEILKIFKLINNSNINDKIISTFDNAINDIINKLLQYDLDSLNRKYLIKNLVLLNNNKFLHK
jgi:hypothetical protein